MAPHPETIDKQEKNIPPKAERVNKTKKTSKINKVAKNKTVAPKSEKVSSCQFTKKEIPVKLANSKVSAVSVKEVKLQKAVTQRNVLPQTGEKQTGLTAIGAVFAAIAGIFSLAAFRKRN